jgi:hypothetical protein
VRPPLALALIVAGLVAGSPALWTARYHIAGVGILTALIAWLTGRPERERLGEAAAACVLIMSIMMFWWTPVPRWWYTPEQLLKLAKATAVEREVDRDLGAPTMRVPGLARERELGPGSLLVFSDRYSGYPSIFWNRWFSNRVLYLRMGPDLLARATRAGASWIFVAEPGIIAQARAPRSGWQEVGPLNGLNGGGLAFRRVPVPPLPNVPPAPPKVAPALPAPSARPIVLPPPATGAPKPLSPAAKPATTPPIPDGGQAVRHPRSAAANTPHSPRVDTTIE